MATTHPRPLPTDDVYINSLGMRLVRIPAGSFAMGYEGAPLPDDVALRPHWRMGDPDERPAHRVRISRAYYLGATEVTNAQYEQFDPDHRRLRGRLGFSTGDDEAVVFVSWHEAAAFCEWLSRREGLPYRLPTEAEWEYACRAGTTTPYSTGDTLPSAMQQNARESWFPDPARSLPEDVVDLTVGRMPPNPWGLYDMHGNVEEWCSDWYGPYAPEEQTDPVGRADGDFRVTRGGSHGTPIYYLRSANRMGALPEDRHWLIGFRVALGEPPAGEPLPAPSATAGDLPLHQQAVRRERPDRPAPAADVPYWAEPRPYVRIPPDAAGPLYAAHNHDPALVECPNGDLLAIWYTCVNEPGRELGILASRLRYGAAEWDPASVFWDAPDRNDHAPCLWRDERGTLYHFCGLSAAATWGSLATILRTSTDNGATWSRARLIMPEHGVRHMPVESVFRTREGLIALPCDATTQGSGGTALWLSADEGRTWRDAGGTIAGIHACVAQLRDGRLLAFGRGGDIEGRMAQSVSDDLGATWTYSASPFPGIRAGQRAVLLRLRAEPGPDGATEEYGPLCFCSFANDPMPIRDASGAERMVTGLYAALSYDDGETWPHRRLVSDDGPGRIVETTDGEPFTMSIHQAEPRGYLSIWQAQDGIVHLITSRQHYAFNLAWLRRPAPAVGRAAG